MNKLNAIAAFVATAENSSFKIAGERLHFSSPTITKLVQALEDSLKVKLLYRNPRSVTLTAQGRWYYEYCSKLMRELDTAEDLLVKDRTFMQGTIRVAITQLGARHLMKFLDRFFLTYPNIDIDFLINNGRVDILQEGCDLWLTVNTGKLNSRGLKRRVLIRQPNIVVASPGYLAKFGNPTSPEDLENHTCIALVNRSPIWVFRSALGSKTVQMRHKITVSSGESLINASIADLGLIYGMALYFSEEIASGRLVRVLPHYEIGSSRLSAIYPSNRYTPKRINAFIDYVQEVTRAEASSFT